MFLFFEKKKNAGLETRAPKKGAVRWGDAFAEAFNTIRPDQAVAEKSRPNGSPT